MINLNIKNALLIFLKLVYTLNFLDHFPYRETIFNFIFVASANRQAENLTLLRSNLTFHQKIVVFTHQVSGNLLPQ